jgi:hypothetical protein
VEKSKVCWDCKKRKPIESFCKTNKYSDGRNSQCKPCKNAYDKSRRDSFRKKHSYSISTFHRKNSKASFFSVLAHTSRQGAKRRKIPFKICKQDIIDLYNKQNGKCALSNFELTFEVGKGHIPTNISIDRIDNNRGYIKNNIQLVCCLVNTMKWEYPITTLYKFCEAILKTKRVINGKNSRRNSKRTTRK